MSALRPSPEDPEWFRWIIVAIFFLLPVIRSVVRSAMGKDKEDDEKEGPGEALERRRRLREKRKQSETEGEDLWRRLARGEVSSPPPAPPRSVRVPAPLPQVPQAESLELEEEPSALAMLGDVSEPGEAPEVKLEREAEPAAFAALAAVSAEEPAGARPYPRLALARGDLRRAIVMSEILAPPVSERALRA